MKPSRRIYWWLLLSLILSILGWVANRRSQSPVLLSRYADQLSEYYRQQEQKLATLLADTLRWKDLYEHTQRLYAVPDDEEIDFLQQRTQETTVWMLFRDSLPVYWTDNGLILGDSLLARLQQTEEAGLVALNTGHYVLKSNRLQAGTASLLVVGAIPIKYAYPVAGPFLKEKFVAEIGDIPPELSVGREGGKAVVGAKGETVFYLSWEDEIIDPGLHLWALILFLTALLFFLLSVNDLANYLARKFHPRLGIILIIGLVAALRVFAGWGGFFDTFSDLSFFQDTIPILRFTPSLGEFLISSLILLWLTVFFHREFQLQPAPRQTGPWPVIVTAVIYSLCVMSLLLVIRIFQGLVLESELIFDFANIFGLDLLTLSALMSGLIIILAVFLFNHRLVQAASQLEIRLPARFLALSAAIMINSPVFFAIGLDLSPLLVLMMVIVYVLGLDYTLDQPSLSLTIVVSWLLFFAVFTSIMVYSFRQKQDMATKMRYANLLCDPRDPVLEKVVERLNIRWRSNNGPASIPGQSDSLPIPPKALIAKLQADFSSEPYLFQHYTFELFAIDRGSGRPLLEGQQQGKGMRLLEVRENTVSSSLEHLNYWPTPNQQNFSYLLDLAPADTSAYWLLALRHRSQKYQGVYGDLLQSIPYKALSQLPRYEYAIFGGPRILKESRELPSDLRLLPTSLKAGRHQVFNEDGQSTVFYHSKENFTALLSNPRSDLFQALSLFSFLFSLMVVFLILLSILNYYWPALAYTFESPTFQRASLRNRIQRAVLLLMVGSFVLVGLFTAGFFRRSALRVGNEQLNEKARAVLSDLERNLANRQDTTDQFQYLAPLIEPIANIHQMDLNIYNLQGRLQLTTAAFFFRSQLTAPLMNPVALQALRLPTQSAYRAEQHLGEMDYQSAYVPIRDKNEEIIAYLELPYYTNVRELENDLQSFLSSLLNIYVFLLLISGAIALFVARSITRPISRIGRKLRQLRLGRNEPLEWKTPDEIGQLIAEYNRMIGKLEESAEKLRQSERENAWREMAKQVAHEIKNPLTPMKLNIQHLLRVQAKDPQQANKMLSEVAQSIIQQIDGLSRIAEEFSNFAKMPQARNELFEVNKLVTSVYHLYAKGNYGATQLKLEMPEDPLEVFADPNQLIRVLNNLIENALQAIPDGRNGLVTIQLKKQGDQVILSVTDNGSGIPLALQERVFFPNFTTKNSGMGLGLAMAKSMVNAAGGNIYFETEAGEGTTFTVQLPLHTNKAES